ncbi:phytanoyl-CoA dioxygenase family protein [Novipirellula sp. SH528]|uniref:phytanoyl-CoA dioxygenase family protein n=1 Tax=Novipirellula sp. SH528 TaxID=3454466 RepID=UPI003FA114AA
MNLIAIRDALFQYINKPPGIGQPTPPHQDGFYFMLEPNEAVTMWLALEDVDEETGCVRYVKGSHNDGLRPHDKTATLGFSQELIDYGPRDTEREIPFPANPGDLLVHHALTIHRADGNRSQTRTRQALGFIYCSSEAVESEEKQKRQAAIIKRFKSQGKL